MEDFIGKTTIRIYKTYEDNMHGRLVKEDLQTILVRYIAVSELRPSLDSIKEDITIRNKHVQRYWNKK